MQGQLLTESFAYDGGRRVTVYVPPAKPEAIVFAGDGQLIAPWGALLERADTAIPPTMVVGAHRLDDEMQRLHEYSPVFDADTFAAHERFFVDDVRAWTRTELDIDLPPERTAVAGVSASGELSLAMGMRHPDLYGVVYCASPGGGYRPPESMPAAAELPRFYLTAGTQEPFFLENLARWDTALRGTGVDLVMTERDANHGDPFWAEEFVRMVAWAFAGER